MTEDFVAKVEVLPPAGMEDEVSVLGSVAFSRPDLDKLAGVINQTVTTLQNQVASMAKADDPNRIGLAEVEVSFGVSLEGESKVPIIGPILGVGVKANATFQVRLTLTRGGK